MYGENVNSRAAVSAGPNYEMWASLFKNGNTGIVLYLVTNEGESIIVFHKDYAVCESSLKRCHLRICFHERRLPEWNGLQSRLIKTDTALLMRILFNTT